MPAQKISSEKAISTSVSASQDATKPESSIPALGRPKIQQHDDDQRRQRAEQVDHEDDQPVERPDAEGAQQRERQAEREPRRR